MQHGSHLTRSISGNARRLSVTVPSVNTNALGYGAFLGLYANLRYQLLNGLDRAVFNRFDVLGVALFFSTALRSALPVDFPLLWAYFQAQEQGAFSHLFSPIN